MDLPWHAESRGLSQSVDVNKFPKNLGPISVHALHYFQLYRVEPRNHRRYPTSVTENDFIIADRVIAICRREHEPMLEKDFSEHLEKVEYFDVEDQEVDSPSLAIPLLIHRIDEYIRNLTA